METIDFKNLKWFEEDIDGDLFDLILYNLCLSDYRGKLKWKYEDIAAIEQKNLFDRFSKDLYKIAKQWNWEDRAGEKRTLAKLSKLAQKVKIEKGQMLVSLFLNSCCERSKEIKTQIDESCFDVVEATDSPLNIDYDTSLVTDGVIKPNNMIEREVIFSTEIKSRGTEPRVICDVCGGRGKQKCPACGGSGREQYVDGYYASGEERIKTGNCSECHGSGTIPCSECSGKGYIEIYAPQYEVIKSVSEKNYSVPYVISSSDKFKELECQFESGYDCYTDIITKILNNEENISLLMKNRNMRITDCSSEIGDEASLLGVLKLYQGNLKSSKNLISENRNRMLIACQEEHYVIPVTKVEIIINEQEYDFLKLFIFPAFDDSVLVAVEWNIPETSFLKGLFL